MDVITSPFQWRKVAFCFAYVKLINYSNLNGEEPIRTEYWKLLFHQCTKQNQIKSEVAYSEWCPQASGLKILFSENKVIFEAIPMLANVAIIYSPLLCSEFMTLPFDFKHRRWFFTEECFKIWSIVYKSDGLLFWTFSVLVKCENFRHFTCFCLIIILVLYHYCIYQYFKNDFITFNFSLEHRHI